MLPSPAATWRAHAHSALLAMRAKHPCSHALQHFVWSLLAYCTLPSVRASAHQCRPYFTRNAVSRTASASLISSARTDWLVRRRTGKKHCSSDGSTHTSEMHAVPDLRGGCDVLSEACSVKTETQLFYSNAYLKTHWHKAVFDTSSTTRQREPKASART